MSKADPVPAEPPQYVINDRTLREELLNPEQARRWCSEHPEHPLTVSYLRMLGDLAAAGSAGEERCRLLDAGSPEWAAAAARLAVVRQWEGDFARAHQLLDSAERVARHHDHQRLIAAVLQHRAKLLFDQRQLGAAVEPAVTALELRLATGDHELVGSSELLLARLLEELPGEGSDGEAVADR